MGLRTDGWGLGTIDKEKGIRGRGGGRKEDAIGGGRVHDNPQWTTRKRVRRVVREGKGERESGSI